MIFHQFSLILQPRIPKYDDFHTDKCMKSIFFLDRHKLDRSNNPWGRRWSGDSVCFGLIPEFRSHPPFLILFQVKGLSLNSRIPSIHLRQTRRKDIIYFHNIPLRYPHHIPTKTFKSVSRVFENYPSCSLWRFFCYSCDSVPDHHH